MMHTYNTVLEATLVANFKVECQFCELKDEIQKLAAQVNSMLEGTKFSFGSLEFGFSKAASVEIVQVFRNGDEGKTYVFPLQDHRYPIFKAKRDSLNQFDVRMRVEYQTEAEIQAKSYSAAVGAFEKLCNIGCEASAFSGEEQERFEVALGGENWRLFWMKYGVVSKNWDALEDEEGGSDFEILEDDDELEEWLLSEEDEDGEDEEEYDDEEYDDDDEEEYDEEEDEDSLVRRANVEIMAFVGCGFFVEVDKVGLIQLLTQVSKKLRTELRKKKIETENCELTFRQYRWCTIEQLDEDGDSVEMWSGDLDRKYNDEDNYEWWLLNPDWDYPTERCSYKVKIEAEYTGYLVIEADGLDDAKSKILEQGDKLHEELGSLRITSSVGDFKYVCLRDEDAIVYGYDDFHERYDPLYGCSRDLYGVIYDAHYGDESWEDFYDPATEECVTIVLTGKGYKIQ